MKKSTKTFASIAAFLIGGGLGFGGTKLYQSLVKESPSIDSTVANVITASDFTEQERQADKEAEEQAEKAADRQAGEQAGRQTEGQAEMQAGKQAERQIESPAERQIERQTERQIERQVEREKERSEIVHQNSTPTSKPVTRQMTETELQGMLNKQDNRVTSGIANKVSSNLHVVVVGRTRDDIMNVSDVNDIYIQMQTKQWEGVTVTKVQRDDNGVITSVTVRPKYSRSATGSNNGNPARNDSVSAAPNF